MVEAVDSGESGTERMRTTLSGSIAQCIPVERRDRDAPPCTATEIGKLASRRVTATYTV
jgi:hypothetical protein